MLIPLDPPLDHCEHCGESFPAGDGYNSVSFDDPNFHIFNMLWCKRCKDNFSGAPYMTKDGKTYRYEEWHGKDV